MSGFLRVVRLLAMVLWVGGLCFFAFVVAPVAFGVLPSKHEAGLVVAGTLRTLNRMGLIGGIVFLMLTFRLWLRSATPQWLLMGELWLVLGMLLATAYVNGRIVPTMERDRIAAGGDVDKVAPDNPSRMDFERLHPVSEKIEGAALLLGLGVVVLLGLEKPSAARAE